MVTLSIVLNVQTCLLSNIDIDAFVYHRTITRRVATGWTGVDMSTPLLPEVVPEIDANPVSFYSGGGGRSWFGASVR